MRILVTAGNTQTPVDPVRCITNIFSGRTGTRLAEEAFWRGHAVTLLTSHPELAEDPPSAPEGATWSVLAYRTFEDLHRLMWHELSERHYDAVIHYAAVSDYEVSGVYARSSDSARHVDEHVDQNVLVVDIKADLQHRNLLRSAAVKTPLFTLTDDRSFLHGFTPTPLKQAPLNLVSIDRPRRVRQLFASIKFQIWAGTDTFHESPNIAGFATMRRPRRLHPTSQRLVAKN